MYNKLQSPISVESLTVDFPNVRALNRVCLQVNEGEIVGLLGPNGAGKSTLYSVLLGLTTPTSGNAYVLGRSCRNANSYLSRIGYSSAYQSEKEYLKVERFLRFFGELYGVATSQLNQRVTDLVQQFQLDQKLDARLDTLSAGQKTCMSICKALIHCPRILLLDEPTASLDPYRSEIVSTTLAKLVSDGDVAGLLYTSHNLEEALNLCHRIVFLYQGYIDSEFQRENGMFDRQLILSKYKKLEEDSGS